MAAELDAVAVAGEEEECGLGENPGSPLQYICSNYRSI